MFGEPAKTYIVMLYRYYDWNLFDLIFVEAFENEEDAKNYIKEHETRTLKFLLYKECKD